VDFEKFDNSIKWDAVESMSRLTIEIDPEQHRSIVSFTGLRVID